MLYVAIYVEDILIFSNDIESITSLKIDLEGHGRSVFGSWTNQKQYQNRPVKLYVRCFGTVQYGWLQFHIGSHALQLRVYVAKCCNSRISLTEINLYCNNKAALQVALNNNYFSRTKHVDIKAKLIR